MLDIFCQIAMFSKKNDFPTFRTVKEDSHGQISTFNVFKKSEINFCFKIVFGLKNVWFRIDADNFLCLFGIF